MLTKNLAQPRVPHLAKPRNSVNRNFSETDCRIENWRWITIVLALVTRHESARLPGEEGHDAVVNDVQGGHVVDFLSRQKEKCVEELGELAEEVPPRGSGHPVT